MSRLTFPDLCAAMERVGVEVHVALEQERHVIRLVGADRSLDLPVTRGFDADTLVACCSLAICPTAPLARAWPELVALAQGLSDPVCPDRLF